MNPGKIVKVYQRPLTDEGYEGEAKLVRKCDYGHHEGFERWEVAFPEDGGAVYERLVRVE